MGILQGESVIKENKQGRTQKREVIRQMKQTKPMGGDEKEKCDSV